MQVPGPPHRVGRDRGMEPPLAELELGIVDPVAALDESEGETTGPFAEAGIVEAKLGVEQGIVAVSELRGQPIHLAQRERRDPPSHLELIDRQGPGRPESAGPRDRAGERAVTPALVAEAQGRGRLAQIQHEAVR